LTISFNFLESNFKYLRLATVRDDKNNKNCPSSLLDVGQKVVRFCLESTKISLKLQENGKSDNSTQFYQCLSHFFSFETKFKKFLGQKLKNSLDSSINFHHSWLLKA